MLLSHTFHQPQNPFESDSFKRAYDFDNAHRTTNHVDRLMDLQDRMLSMPCATSTALKEAASLMTRSAAKALELSPLRTKSAAQSWRDMLPEHPSSTDSRTTTTGLRTS